MNLNAFKAPKIIIRATLLIVGVAFLVYLIASGVQAFRFPDEFVQARAGAAAVSQHIVDLAVLTSDKLAEVNLSDLGGETAKALALLSDARAANRSAYGKAFELTQYLRALAESLKSVPSASKQREGSEAIAIELSLVSEFIVYTQEVDEFLDALERAIRSGAEADRAAAAAALSNVNERVASINSLNASFRQAIGVFDGEE